MTGNWHKRVALDNAVHQFLRDSIRIHLLALTLGFGEVVPELFEIAGSNANSLNAPKGWTRELETA